MKKLQAYRSHKTVHAAPIVALLAPSEVHVRVPDGTTARVDPVPARFFSADAEKHPQIGDYVVWYGGAKPYVSWSPKAEFEAGYTAIEAPGPIVPGVDPDASTNGMPG